MKFNSIIFSVLLTVTSIDAGILSFHPTSLADAIQLADKAASEKPVPACKAAGQGCGLKEKLKRAADAAAEALAEPITFAEPPHRFCYKPDGACSKAKREALALAEAAAEAYAIADPEAKPCYVPGGSCSVEKREAIEAAEAMAKRDALAFPDAEAGKSKSYSH